MSDPAAGLSAGEVIATLGLEPHPEGGYFRETFRDSVATDGRAASTAIYFLLQAGEVSRWHRVDATEVWHRYAGASLTLRIRSGAGPASAFILGADLGAGEQPQIVVPANAWQSARSNGAWTLVGCTVAPGFEFCRFEMAPEGRESA